MRIESTTSLENLCVRLLLTDNTLLINILGMRLIFRRMFSQNPTEHLPAANTYYAPPPRRGTYPVAFSKSHFKRLSTPLLFQLCCFILEVPSPPFS